MSMMVHHAPQSRPSRLPWPLEELGADYRIRHVDILRRDGQGRADAIGARPTLKRAWTRDSPEGQA
ncbi:MAG: hypothetical protein J0I52_05930 [Bordetella sp.]|nr:hypothetical protein [Bordetella sp.]